MIDSLPPGLLLILGGLLLPLFRGVAQSVALLALPVLSAILALLTRNHQKSNRRCLVEAAGA